MSGPKRSTGKFPRAGEPIRFARPTTEEKTYVQPRPTAAELLASVAELLDRDVVPALDGPVQHHARVAASLVAIVERELRLAQAAASNELTATQRVLADARADGGTPPSDLEQARSQLADALRAGMADDAVVAARVWEVLMGVARDDLSISKPGHDSWSGD
jgi:hypothetical protein